MLSMQFIGQIRPFGTELEISTQLQFYFQSLTKELHTSITIDWKYVSVCTIR